MYLRMLMHSLMNHQAEEAMESLVEALNEVELDTVDAEDVRQHLAQVCEIAGLECPNSLHDL